MSAKQSAARKGGFALHGAIIAALIFVGVPWFPCPARCGEPAPQLVDYTKLPGVSEADARRMMDWGASFPCPRCGKLRRISIVTEILFACPRDPSGWLGWLK
jgi:hypothetical protein